MSVVEVTTFTLRDGADEGAFLVADRRVQTELIPNQPGFMRRTTARQGAHWLVVTLWASLADAEAFEVIAKGHPVHAEFERHVEDASISARRFETLD